MQKDKLKQYSGLLIIGILLIVVYKVFEPSWFSVLLNACFLTLIQVKLCVKYAPSHKGSWQVC